MVFSYTLSFGCSKRLQRKVVIWDRRDKRSKTVPQAERLLMYVAIPLRSTNTPKGGYTYLRRNLALQFGGKMKANLLGLVLVVAGAANAAIVIDVGNNPQPPEYNVLLTSGVTGTQVTGTFNEFPGLNAVFTSTQTLEEDASGQARILASGGSLLDNITISLSGGNTFGDLIFALNPPSGNVPNPSYSITANGTLTSQSSAGSVTTGNPFFTIVATGEQLTSVSISSSGLGDIRQIRFSDITAPGGGGGGGGEIPEPSTFAMLGGSIIAIALGRKFRSQS